MGPVLEDQEGGLEDFGGIRGDLEHVDRFVEAGEGVEVGPEAHADRLHEIDELLLGEVPGPVEGHVLDHVGQAQLVLVLEDRAGVDDQAQLGPVLRLPVFADVITEAVPELADRDLGVDGDLLVEGILIDLGGGSRRSGRVLAPSRAGHGGQEQSRQEDGHKGEEAGSGLVFHRFHHSRFGKLLPPNPD